MLPGASHQERVLILGRAQELGESFASNPTQAFPRFACFVVVWNEGR